MKQVIRALDDLATEMFLNLELFDDTMNPLLLRLSRNVTALRALMSESFQRRLSRALANGDVEKDVFEHIAERINPNYLRSL